MLVQVVPQVCRSLLGCFGRAVDRSKCSRHGLELLLSRLFFVSLLSSVLPQRVLDSQNTWPSTLGRGRPQVPCSRQFRAAVKRCDNLLGKLHPWPPCDEEFSDGLVRWF